MESSGSGDTTTPMSGSGGLQYPLYGEEEEWPTGYELFDGYHVVRLLGRGGMGAVYLVERRLSGGRVQFAVKTLIPSLTQNESYRRRFLRELRTWIDLPAHPNIARCYFFRTVDQRLAIFSEYVDAGSLEEWIRKRKLNDVEKILDILIQVAWALSCAHECGVVHQDIKPSNIMLNQNGIVKLVDFGLAKSRFSRRAQEVVTESGRTVLISSSGWTLAYCSPEQLEAKPISRKTDIWSFGVSVLEIFNGGVTWRYGASADIEFKRYLEWCGRVRARLPVMPDPLARVVDRCLQSKPDQRWRNATDLADALMKVYRDVTGRKYHREYPQFVIPVKKSEEDMERRTILGSYWKDPKIFLERVCRILSIDPEEVQQSETSDKTSRMSRSLVDLEIFNKAESLLAAYLDEFTSDKSARYVMGALLLEKAIVLESCNDFSGAVVEYRKAMDYIKDLKDVKSRDCYARCHYNSAISLQFLGKKEEAFKAFDEAVNRYKELADETKDPAFFVKWASAIRNKAITLDAYGFNKEAMKLAYKSVAILEKLSEYHQSDRLDKAQGLNLLNLASFVQTYGDVREAIKYLRKCIEYYEGLFYRGINYEDAYYLGITYYNMAMALTDIWQLDEAHEWVDRSIEFCSARIESRDMSNLRVLVADAYFLKGQIYFKQKKRELTLECLDKSMDIMVDLIERQCRHEYNGSYGQLRLFKSLVKMFPATFDPENTELRETVDFWKYLFKKDGINFHYTFFSGGLLGWVSREHPEIRNSEWNSWMTYVDEVLKMIGDQELICMIQTHLKEFLSDEGDKLSDNC